MADEKATSKATRQSFSTVTDQSDDQLEKGAQYLEGRAALYREVLANRKAERERGQSSEVELNKSTATDGEPAVGKSSNGAKVHGSDDLLFLQDDIATPAQAQAPNNMPCTPSLARTTNKALSVHDNLRTTLFTANKLTPNKSGTAGGGLGLLNSNSLVRRDPIKERNKQLGDMLGSVPVEDLRFWLEYTGWFDAEFKEKKLGLVKRKAALNDEHAVLADAVKRLEHSRETQGAECLPAKEAVARFMQTPKRPIEGADNGAGADKNGDAGKGAGASADRPNKIARFDTDNGSSKGAGTQHALRDQSQFQRQVSSPLKRLGGSKHNKGGRSGGRGATPSNANTNIRNEYGKFKAPPPPSSPPPPMPSSRPNDSYKERRLSVPPPSTLPPRPPTPIRARRSSEQAESWIPSGGRFDRARRSRTPPSQRGGPRTPTPPLNQKIEPRAPRRLPPRWSTTPDRPFIGSKNKWSDGYGWGVKGGHDYGHGWL